MSCQLAAMALKGSQLFHNAGVESTRAGTRFSMVDLHDDHPIELQDLNDHIVFRCNANAYHAVVRLCEVLQVLGTHR